MTLVGDQVVSELLDIDAEVDGVMLKVGEDTTLEVIIDDTADVTLELELGLWDTAVDGEMLKLELEL